MRKAILIRYESTNEGTFGMLRVDPGKFWHSGELNWHDNQNGISCIPEGTYTCKWFNSPKHGWCYQVYDVPNRHLIEIHSANWMGDTPLIKQLEGCIALGKDIGVLSDQKCLLKSKVAIQEFEEEMNTSDFQLTIVRQ